MLSSVFPSKSHSRFTNEETKAQRREITSPGPTDLGWQSLTISSTVNKYFSVGILTCLFPISLRLGARHQIFKGLRCLGNIWVGMAAVRRFPLRHFQEGCPALVLWQATAWLDYGEKFAQRDRGQVQAMGWPETPHPVGLSFLIF